MSSKRFVLVASSVAVALTAVVASAFGPSDPGHDECAASEACAAVVTVVEPAVQELVGLEEEEVLIAASNWTHSGCISLGGNCYDVYSDSRGTLWVCLACGTTGNPSPGKCRKLTAYEIEHSLWCS